jgi:uncharacterized membrane protein YfcA
MTPLLILLFGVHPATAVGTDLLFAAATKTGGTLVHGLARTIDWTVVRGLASGSVPSTALTLLVLSRFDVHGAAIRDVITSVLSLALLVTGRAAHLPQEAFDILCDACRRAFCAPDQLADLGVGGGAGRVGVDLLSRRRRHRRHVSNPALPPPSHGEDRRLRHRPCGALDARRRLGHWMLGSVDWHIFGSLLVGSLPGIFLGSYLSARVVELALRIILALTLAVVGNKVAFEQIQNRLATLVSSPNR